MATNFTRLFNPDGFPARTSLLAGVDCWSSIKDGEYRYDCSDGNHSASCVSKDNRLFTCNTDSGIEGYPTKDRIRYWMAATLGWRASKINFQ